MRGGDRIGLDGMNYEPRERGVGCDMSKGVVHIALRCGAVSGIYDMIGMGLRGMNEKEWLGGIDSLITLYFRFLKVYSLLLPLFLPGSTAPSSSYSRSIEITNQTKSNNAEGNGQGRQKVLRERVGGFLCFAGYGARRAELAKECEM